jgi:hypothetical protein
MARGPKPEPTTQRSQPPKRRAGLPDEASVVEERELRSPKGTKYRLLRTNQKDAYDNDDGPKAKRPRGE